MATDREIVRVVGAVPAGLAAAITVAHAGRRVVVHEAQREVGHRFGADLQRLENWPTLDDMPDGFWIVLDERVAPGGYGHLPVMRGVGWFDGRVSMRRLRSSALRSGWRPDGTDRP